MKINELTKDTAPEKRIIELDKVGFMRKLRNTVSKILVWGVMVWLTRVGEGWADRALLAWVIFSGVAVILANLIYIAAESKVENETEEEQEKFLRQLMTMTKTNRQSFFSKYSAAFVGPIIFAYLFIVGYVWTGILYFIFVLCYWLFLFLLLGMQLKLMEKLNVEVKKD
jgi:hypothetical protein